MGKIIDMQNNQDKIGFNYIKRRNPKLDTKGIKNFYNKLRLAYKPGIETEYSLTREQKKFARTVRGTTLGIMVLASSISIGGVISNHMIRENNKTENYIELQALEILSKETVLDNAEQTLIEIIFPTIHIYPKSVHVSYPSRDEYKNLNSVQVEKLVGQNYNSYYRYINEQESVNKDNSEIFNEFANMMIKIKNNSNPSQEDLEKLEELTEQVSEMNLKLDKNNIVNSDEKNMDLER